MKYLNILYLLTFTWIPCFSTKALSYEFLFVSSNNGQSETLQEYLKHRIQWMSISNIVIPLNYNQTISANANFRLITLIDNCDEEMSLNLTGLVRHKSTVLCFLSKENLIHPEYNNLDIGNKVYILKPPSFIFHKSLVHKIFEKYSVKNSNYQHAFTIRNPFSGYIFDCNTLIQLERNIPRRLDFLGSRIIGVSELKKDLVELDVFGNVLFHGGYNVEEYRYLKDFLNFTEETVPWKGYVSLDPQGQLLGMGKQVIVGEADISIQSQEILLYRAEKLTFLIPNLNNIETLYAFFKQSSSTFIKNPYIEVFRVDTWMAYLFTWGMIGVSLYTGMLLLNKLYEESQDNNYLFSNTWNWIIGTICLQGVPLSLFTTYHIKIILVVSLFFSYFTFQVFNCSLVAVLSHPNYLIHSFSDMLKHGFQLYHEKDTNNAYDFLQDLTDKGLLTQKLDKSIHSVLAEEGLSHIQEGKTAFISPIYLFYPKLPRAFLPEKLCQIVSKVKVEGFTTRSAMFIQKNSPFTEYFFYTLMRMTEFGVRDRLSKKYRVNSVTLRCLEDTKRAPDAVRLEDTVSIMIILGSGIGLSTFIFLFEFFSHNHQLRTNQIA